MVLLKQNNSYSHKELNNNGGKNKWQIMIQHYQ